MAEETPQERAALASEPGPGAAVDATGAAEVAAIAGTDPSGAARKAGKAGKGGYGWGFWIAVGWAGATIVLSAIAGWLPIPEPTALGGPVASGPTEGHLLGTDMLGRDILSRLLIGARASLLVGVFAVLIGAIIGSVLGMIAGYFRGRVESLIMGGADVLLAFPALILLIALMGVLGQTMTTLIIGLGLVGTPTFARLARATTLVFRRQEFVLAAQALGARDPRVIVREILPNVAMPIGSYAFIILAVIIVAEGSLSFLGVGIPPPTPSWGSMIAAGRDSLERAPHITFIPSVVMFLTVLAFNVIGDKLRQRADVRSSAL